MDLSKWFWIPGSHGLVCAPQECVQLYIAAVGKLRFLRGDAAEARARRQALDTEREAEPRRRETVRAQNADELMLTMEGRRER